MMDCRKCGACCVPEFDEPTHADCAPDDLKRMSSRTVALHVLDGSMRTKRDRCGNAVCSVLRGTIGTRVSCGIYETRPQVCVAFAVGSDACLEARLRLGLS